MQKPDSFSTEHASDKRRKSNRRYGGIFADFYRAFIRDLLKNDISRQRLKLIYDVWWYHPLLTSKTLTLGEKIVLMVRLMRIDWSILNGTKPAEIVPVLLEIAKRPAKDGEAIAEAGCWKGGSTAKISLVCKMRGYRLHVYDSFQGVPEWSFDYAASEAEVGENVGKYGDLSLCTFHPGWFRDTLWSKQVDFPIRMVYIDCDTPSGTLEVLSGVMPRLVEDGVVYTQDYHISSVRRLVESSSTWRDLGVTPPVVTPLVRNIARISWC